MRRGPADDQYQTVGVASDSDHMASVLKLSKPARNTVGFLPDAAFHDRARQGTLIAVVERGDPVGYAMFDLPRDEIKLVHLVVAPSHARRGLARVLVDEIERRHPARRGIILSCRNDYPAHRAWPRLGFVPLGERVGQSVDGKPLTWWWKNFGHPNLFSILDEDDLRPVAVLDSCTFFDLVNEPPGEIAQQLRADWVGDHTRLAITDEVLVEIARGADGAARARQRTAAQRLPQLSPVESAWSPLVAELKRKHPTAPPSDESDIRQLARAIAAGARWFITDDPKLKNRYAKSAADLSDLRTLTPAEFIRDLDAIVRADWYEPAELDRTEVEIREVDAATLTSLAHTFVNHQAGETIGALRADLARWSSEPHRIRLQVISVDDQPRGLWCLEHIGDELRCHVLRVTAGRGESVIARHLLSKLREQRTDGQVLTVRLRDAAMSDAARRNLGLEGYLHVPGTSERMAISARGHGTVDELRSILNSTPLHDGERAVLAAALERAEAVELDVMFAPFIVTDTGMPIFVVPIKHHWAIQLFDAALAQSQLLARNWDLGLRRELVYYRSSSNSGRLRAPARIAWYVSGANSGGQSIRAVSLLREVLVAPPAQLYHRFQRLGIYQAKDVDGAAGSSGVAMALRFTGTRLLPEPVPLATYRRISTACDRTVVLRAPQEATASTLVEILRAGAL